MQLIENTERVPVKFLNAITGTHGMYEIRIITASDAIPTFCFFDEGKLIGLINAFHMKTRKKPPRELARAMRLRKECLNEKA